MNYILYLTTYQKLVHDLKTKCKINMICICLDLKCVFYIGTVIDFFIRKQHKSYK